MIGNAVKVMRIATGEEPAHVLGDFIALMEAEAPKPGPCDPYKRRPQKFQNETPPQNDAA